MARKFPNQYDRARDVYTDTEGPTKAQQQFKDECDMNNIVAKYARQGTPLSSIPNTGRYGDFSNIPDYQAAMNQVNAAASAFHAQPAALRDRFKNDVASFVSFVRDPKNQDELIKLGLATRRPAPPQPSDGEPQKTKKKSEAPPAAKPPKDED